eukprot:EG_transcript_816
MRLATIFLAVLAGAVLATSLTAWGITFGASFDRISTMASRFSAQTQAGIAAFDGFAQRLLQDNAQLVTDLLAQQRESGNDRMQQTKDALLASTGTLVNLTTNATQQMQLQMGRVVDTFGAVMDAVVADFKGLASGYAAQVRADLLARGLSEINTIWSRSGSLLRRQQTLLDVGALSLSQSPTDPIGDADCTLLDLLCDHAMESYADAISIVSTTGRLYTCGVAFGATVSLVTSRGALYNESHLTWPLFPTTPRRVKQRCLQDAPTVRLVGLNCPQPLSCQCGADPRCRLWYRTHLSTGTALYAANALEDPPGTLRLHTTMSLVNSSAAPPALLGVIDVQVDVSGADYVMAMLVELLPQVSLASLLNDTRLTTLASIARKCATNESVPGDPSLPVWSGLRACDPGLRAVAQRLAADRTVAQPFSLPAAGLIWDVVPVRNPITSFFLIMGTNRSLVDAPIDASEDQAEAQLAAVRAGLVKNMAAVGAAFRSYVATLGTRNVQTVQGLQDQFLAEIQAMDEASRATLTATQQLNAAKVQLAVAEQSAAVAALKEEQLAAMATATGWTFGIVAAALLLVLGCSAWGTVRITYRLAAIIVLMEDVANLRVEDLEVPQASSVTEVARIQTAFQVLVKRLAEYKSYIPAGVLEPQGGAPGDGDRSDRDSASGRDSRPRASVAELADGRTPSCGPQPRPRLARKPSCVPSWATHRSGGVSPSPRSAGKRAAVLCAHAWDFAELLLGAGEPVAKNIFNDYVALFHEVVSQGRGNIDCVLGDQIIATFNAHLPCGDAASAAVATAAEVRHQLLLRLGDRLRFQVGVAVGAVFANSVGYAKFKSLVTVGGPLKLAAALAQMQRFDSGTILIDAHLEERVKFSHHVRPVDLVHMSPTKSSPHATPVSQTIFAVMGKKQLQENEWLYQIGDAAEVQGDELSAWAATFDALAAAASLPEAQALLQRYLADNPEDAVALRLRDRLPFWIPGSGTPL